MLAPSVANSSCNKAARLVASIRTMCMALPPVSVYPKPSTV